VRYLSFERNGKPTWGAVKDDGVVDLGARCGDHFPTLRDAVGQNAAAALAAVVAATAADLPLAGLRHLPPVPNPEKIICVGVNYANRNEEYRDNSELPKYPSLFIRMPDTLVGHGAPILRPPESLQLDYEGEIALVIGKSGRRIPEERAWDHVFGVSCLNEGTIRDWLRHGKFNVTQGKNFEASGAWGPWLVTSDEFTPGAPIAVTTTVNGETRQQDTTDSLIFSFGKLIHYISTFITLKPGDVIATGTPTGAGARFDPPKWLKPGDVVEVTVSGVGTLRNPVVDEKV
jgi:2-keto-4-pentenoate hydratase/2-oxohepta-3-ene-1,7-dioic acid hydratase in catechol pathway